MITAKDNLPAKAHTLLRTQLDERQYTLSLIQEASRNGLLGPDDLERIQIELMSAMNTIVQEYTRGQSYSVRTSDAQKLLGSLLYGLDLYFKSQASPDDAVAILAGSRSADLIQASRQAVGVQVARCRTLLRLAGVTRIPVILKAYHHLFNHGFPEFLAHYDDRFDVQFTQLDIDYPLLSDDMSQTGIIYAVRYLEHLLLEQTFCAVYDPDAIDRLLLIYGRKYGIPGQDLLINLVELLLKQSLASLLLGRPATDIDINAKVCLWLEKNLQDLPDAQAEQRLAAAREKLLPPDQPDVAAYLRPFAELYSRQLLAAARQNNLPAYLAVKPSQTRAVNNPVKAGRRLSDSALRSLIDRLADLPDVDQRIDQALASVHHADDLIELLNIPYFWDQEYQNLFVRLGDYELAVLAKVCFDCSPAYIDLDNDGGKAPVCWQNQDDDGPVWQQPMKEYLESLDINRQVTIRRLAADE